MRVVKLRPAAAREVVETILGFKVAALVFCLRFRVSG